MLLDRIIKIEKKIDFDSSFLPLGAVNIKSTDSLRDRIGCNWMQCDRMD